MTNELERKVLHALEQMCEDSPYLSTVIQRQAKVIAGLLAQNGVIVVDTARGDGSVTPQVMLYDLWCRLRAQARQGFVEQITGVDLTDEKAIEKVNEVFSKLLAGWDKDFPKPGSSND